MGAVGTDGSLGTGSKGDTACTLGTSTDAVNDLNWSAMARRKRTAMTMTCATVLAHSTQSTHTAPRPSVWRVSHTYALHAAAAMATSITEAKMTRTMKMMRIRVAMYDDSSR